MSRLLYGRRLAFPLIVLAVTADGLNSTASGDSPGADNDFYRVFVEDRGGRDGVGVFTIGSGPGAFAGARLLELWIRRH